jgi:hypothetical protein
MGVEMGSLKKKALGEKVPAILLPCLLFLIVIALFCIDTAEAERIELRIVGDKTITCMRSGLMSDLNNCAKPDWYTCIFVGFISSITPYENDEKQIQITPEEIFYGTPISPLAVRTSQGECLPKLVVGDRWLFFLRNENGKPMVLDYYGNDSRPIADAEEQIKTFRRLKSTANRGIERGRVLKGFSFSDRKAVSNAQVIARRLSDDVQFLTKTDDDGRYEFEPLPSGKYQLSAQPIGSFQPDNIEIEVSGGSCWDRVLTRSPHIQIGGHIKRSDGSPVPQVEVLLIDENESLWNVIKANDRGHFQIDWLNPGEYVIGINLPGAPPWESRGGAGIRPPAASMYYPGVLDRSKATIITLAPDEKRDDIDFIAPIQ